MSRRGRVAGASDAGVGVEHSGECVESVDQECGTGMRAGWRCRRRLSPNTNEIHWVAQGPGGAGCRPTAPVAEGGPIGSWPMGGTTGGFPTGPGGRGGAGDRTRTLSL